MLSGLLPRSCSPSSSRESFSVGTHAKLQACNGFTVSSVPWKTNNSVTPAMMTGNFKIVEPTVGLVG